MADQRPIGDKLPPLFLNGNGCGDEKKASIS
jgi:hypothetical protein